MKKLLSLVLAVALCAVMVLGTALAADTDLGLAPSDTNYSGNGTITEAINNAPAGAKLVITVKYTRCLIWDGSKEGYAASNYGIGGLCTDGGWSNINPDFSATAPDYGVDDEGAGKEVPLNTVLTFTYDIDALKKAASGDINVNFYNGFEIVKAVIRTADAGEPAKTADTTTVVLFGAVAVVALAAVVASKKARA